MNYNQFLHVEIEKFWRDNTPVMTDFYLKFFKETAIKNYETDSFYDFFLDFVYPDILRNNAKDSVSFFDDGIVCAAKILLIYL